MSNEQYSELIKNYRYKPHSITLFENGRHINRYFIVIVDRETNVIESITDYADYCLYSYKKDRKYTLSNEYILYSVVRFLNYTLIENYEKNQIKNIEEISIEMVYDFLNHYALTPTKKNIRPSKDSIRQIRNHISDFLVNLCSSLKMKKITEEMICEDRLVLDKNDREVHRRKYRLMIIYDDSSNGYRFLNRDMPLKIIERFIKMAKTYDKELVFPIVLMAFAGLRVGEIVNLRRKSSCYGPSLLCHIPNGYCQSIEIDLSTELVLRSDGICVGRIKKERHQSICPAFCDMIYKYYQYHLLVTRDKPMEKFEPMFLSSSKKNGVYPALTKAALVYRLKNLFFSHVLPSLEFDSNIDFRLYFESMKGRTWGPHSFRHWFTVLLVLMGFDEVQVMSFRGDNNIMSSRKYLERKGELQRLYCESNEILGQIINGEHYHGVDFNNTNDEYD